MKEVEVTQNIQSAYDNQYSTESRQWRELGAKFKFQNILEVTKGESFKKVLEYGAGDGSILKFANESQNFDEIHALEISRSGVQEIEKRKLSKVKEAKLFDGYDSGYGDKEFDLVYCSHVIEHVEYPRLVLREIKRISKYQVFEVPLDYSRKVDARIKHFLGYGHINIYTPSLFRYLLKSEGFQIEKEKFSPFEKEVLHYQWYEKLGLKKSMKNRLKALLFLNKAAIARMLFGKVVSNEFYNSAYTCYTSDAGDMEIFKD